MKKNNTCTKCSCTDIIRIPGQVTANGAGNNVRINLFSYVYVSRYLCSDCGFSEEWIDNAADIQKLKKKYKDS